MPPFRQIAKQHPFTPGFKPELRDFFASDVLGSKSPMSEVFDWLTRRGGYALPQLRKLHPEYDDAKLRTAIAIYLRLSQEMAIEAHGHEARRILTNWVTHSIYGSALQARDAIVQSVLDYEMYQDEKAALRELANVARALDNTGGRPKQFTLADYRRVVGILRAAGAESPSINQIAKVMECSLATAKRLRREAFASDVSKLG